MDPRRLLRCEICGSRLAEDRVGNCCGPCHRMIRCMQCRDSRAKHPRSDVDPFDAYNGLGPATAGPTGPRAHEPISAGPPPWGCSTAST